MSAQEQAAGTSPSQEIAESAHSFIKRWKHRNLFERGYLVVPSLFLHHYAHLKPHSLTPGEAMFVLHLMEFKWDAKAPFPGYKTLAVRMGLSDKMVRRYAQSLEAKKYLKREMRVGRTNRFDLTPLFDALSKAVGQKQKSQQRASKKASKGRLDNLITWFEQMMATHKLLSDKERGELAEWESEHVDGSGKFNTSDWPGWEAHIGKRPE